MTIVKMTADDLKRLKEMQRDKPLWQVSEEDEAYQQRKAMMEYPEQTEPDYA